MGWSLTENKLDSLVRVYPCLCCYGTNNESIAWFENLVGVYWVLD